MANLYILRGSTVCTQPEHIDDVMRIAEPVFGCNRPSPVLNGVGRYLDGEAAGPTDEVVMVRGGRARPIQALAFLLQRVGLTLPREIGKGSIYRGEANGCPSLP